MPIVEKIISLIAPHYCLVCGKEDSLLCVGCQPDVFIPPQSACALCDVPTVDFAVCKNCRPKTALSHVWTVTTYGGGAKELIHRFKFDNARAAALPLAEAMGVALPFFDSSTVIVALPTASSHSRVRGFDHTLFLARELSKLTGLRRVTLLTRNHNMRQLGQSRKQREMQTKGAFRAINVQQCEGAHILLVDDVLTTGSSLKAAAHALKMAGAAYVDAVVIAKQAMK